MKEKAPRTDGAGEYTPERDHPRSRTAYPTDLANAEWTRLRSCLPEPNPAGRPRRHCLRETLCDLLRSQDRLSLEAVAPRFSALADSLQPLPALPPEGLVAPHPHDAVRRRMREGG